MNNVWELSLIAEFDGVGNLLSVDKLVCCRVQLVWNSVAGVAHGIFQNQQLFVLTSLINLLGYHEYQNICSLRVARLLLTIDLYVT